MTEKSKFRVGEHFNGSELITKVTADSMETIEDVSGKGIFEFAYDLIDESAFYRGKEHIPLNDSRSALYAHRLGLGVN